MASIVEKVRAARRLEVEHGGARYRLEVPTETDLRRLYRPHTSWEGEGAKATPRIDALASQRDIVLHALKGWEGVTERALGGGDDPLAFSPDAAQELIDDDLKLQDALASAMWDAVNARRERLEADEKN